MRHAMAIQLTERSRDQCTVARQRDWPSVDTGISSLYQLAMEPQKLINIRTYLQQTGVSRRDWNTWRLPFGQNSVRTSTCPGSTQAPINCVRLSLRISFIYKHGAYISYIPSTFQGYECIILIQGSLMQEVTQPRMYELLSSQTHQVGHLLTANQLISKTLVNQCYTNSAVNYTVIVVLVFSRSCFTFDQTPPLEHE